MSHILVVEDEVKIAQALCEGLIADQYQVTLAHSGEEGFFQLHERRFDLVILDLMLPGRDGLDVLRTLRRNDHSTPVLVLTARDTMEDRVRGLDTGADDYLVKPFNFPELLARIRALLRRGRPDEEVALSLADLVMDLASHRVTRAGQLIELTAREFELLEYLLRHKGRIVSRDMLARDVWQEAGRVTPLDNIIDVHMGRLRKKVDQSFQRRLIQTVRGVGFVLREETP